MPIIQTNRRQHVRDLIQIDTLPVDITDEQQLRTGVVNDVDRIVRTKILKDWYNDCAVRYRCQVHSHPVAVVFTHHGNLVVLLDAAFLEQDMQFLDVNGQLTIGQGHVCSVIRHGLHVPMGLERPLKILNKIIFLFRHHNCITV